MSVKGYIPGKHALISGLIVTFVGLFIYNRVPKVKAVLQGTSAS